jgi:ParB/RepB/Spo0J family partition protein
MAQRAKPGPPSGYAEIPLELIDDPEIPLRAEIDDLKLEELVADIRQNGLYYPLIVHAKGERWEVRDGHRRLLACRRLQLAKVPCIIHDENSPPPEAVKLKTNLMREDNTDAEIALWLQELVEKHAYNLEQLCQACGRSENWVNERYDLLRGDPGVFEALGERKINFTQAKVLNQCPDKQLRGIGLHYAIVDHLPAVRLREWFVRNLSNVPNVQPMPVVAEAVNADGTPVAPGIVCDWCGGHKDPQNMVSVWLHRWEWDQVRQILESAHEQRMVTT